MKRLLILLALIFVPTCDQPGTSWAQCTEETPCPQLAKLNPYMGGGVPTGGAAASGTYHVNGDTGDYSYNDWYGYGSDDTGIYLYIDDTTESPDDPGKAGNDYVYGGFSARTYTFYFTEITGTISTIRFWVHGSDRGEAAGILQVDISQDGSTWNGARNINLPDTTPAADWASVDFTGLSWTNTTDLRGRLIRTADGASENIYVWAVYLQVNP